MANESALRQFTAFTPEEEDRLDRLRDIPDDQTVFSVPVSLGKEYEQGTRDELMNAIRSESNPMKRAALEDSYRQDFGAQRRSVDDDMADVFAAADRVAGSPARTTKAQPQQDLSGFDDMADVFAAADSVAKPPKQQRGTFAEIGRQLVGGLASSAPKMINQAGQAFSPEGSAAETMFKENAQYWADAETGWKPDTEGRSRVAKGFIEAAGQIGPSVAAMGLTMANPAVGAAATATLFGGSQFTETWEKAQPLVKQGKMSKDEAFMAALKTGGIEGFGETIADLMGAKFLKGGAIAIRRMFGSGGIEAAAQLAKDPRWAKRFATGAVGNAAVQSGTEFGQGYGEAAVERNAGISQDDPMDVGLRGAEIGGYQSILMLPLGLPGSVRAARQREAAGKVIDDPSAPPELRQRAADFMREEMMQSGGVSKQDADAWRTQQLSSRAELETILNDDRPVEEILAEPEQPVMAEDQPEDTEFADLQKQEESDLAYRRRDLTDEQSKQRDLATVADESALPVALYNAEVGNRVAAVADASGEPTAMQLAMQRAQERKPAGDGTRAAPVQAETAESISNFGQPPVNGASSNADFFGDSATTKAIRTQGFQSLNRGDQAMVLSHVAGLLDQKEVLKSIVEAVPVDVMNSLIGEKVTPERLLHNPSMLKNRLAVSSETPILQSVTRFINALSSVIERLPTGLVTKEDGLPSSALSPKGAATKSAGSQRGLDALATTESSGGGSVNSVGLPGKADAAGTANKIKDGHVEISIGDQVDTVNINPSEAQKDAGVYKKGHFTIQGLDIAIENPAGSVRSGVDKAGKPWSNVLRNTYGYLKGATASDGDKLDAFIGPDPQSQQVFVIDQIDPDTGHYDEAKVMLGFGSIDEARAAYLSNYDAGWQGLGDITPMVMPAFKAWIAKGDTRKALSYDEKASIAQRKADAEQIALLNQQANEPAAPSVQTPVPPAQPEPVAAAALTPMQIRMRALAEAKKAKKEKAANAAQAAQAVESPKVQNLPQAAPEAGALPEQLSDAEVMRQLSEAEKAARMYGEDALVDSLNIQWENGQIKPREQLAILDAKLKEIDDATAAANAKDKQAQADINAKIASGEIKPPAPLTEREQFNVNPIPILQGMIQSGEIAGLLKAAKVKTIDAFKSLPMSERMAAFDRLRSAQPPSTGESPAAQSGGITPQEEAAETRNPPEVAQPTQMKRVSFDAQTLNGPKKVSGHLFELPNYKGPQLAVVEYKLRGKQGYRVYLPKSGVMIADSNAVGTMNDTLKVAVQRVSRIRSKANGTPPQPTPQAQPAERRPVLGDARQALPQGKDTSSPVPGAVTVDQGEDKPVERAYTKGQAEVLARRMTNQGLPSEAYPHPTQAGMWAIGVPGEQKSAPAEEIKLGEKIPPKSPEVVTSPPTVAAKDGTGLAVLKPDEFAKFVPWVAEQLNKAEAKGAIAILTSGTSREYVIYTKGNRTGFDGTGTNVVGESSGDPVELALRRGGESEIIAMTSAAKADLDARKERIEASQKAQDEERTTKDAERNRIESDRQRYFDAIQNVPLPKGAKKTVDFANSRGKFSITGTDYGGLLVDKTTEEKEPYRVTDIESGLRVAAFRSMAQAKDFIRGVIHADLPRGDLSKLSEADMGKWREVARAHRNGDVAPSYFTAAEPAAAPEPKTIAEASLGDLLRAAADKADGKASPESGKPAATKEPVQGAEKVPEETLMDLRLLQESRGRWQYKFAIESSWMTANTKEDAVERATATYFKTPEGERLTSQQRADKADADEFAQMDQNYRMLSLEQLRTKYESLGGEIATNQRAGEREFNGNGGRRTGAAVSNEAARAGGEERMKLARYIAKRNDGLVKAKETDTGIALNSEDRRIGADPSKEESATIEAAFRGKNAVEAAEWLAENAPERLRLVARKTRDNLKRQQANGMTFEMNIGHRGYDVPEDLLRMRGLAKMHGSFRPNVISVWLNGADVVGKVGTSYETALHELAHAATMAAIEFAGTKKADGLPIQQHVEDLEVVTNAIIDHINQRFKDAADGKIDLTEIEQAIQQRKVNTLSNVDEVLAWTLTNRDVQDYLETIPYRKQTLWSAFVDAVRKVLGMSPQANTALSEVLRVSEAILDDRTNNLRGLMSDDGLIYRTQQSSDGSTLLLNPGGRYRDDDGGGQINSLEDDQRSAVSRAIDRAIAIEQGKDVKPLQVIRVRNRIGKLRADLEAGKISEALFISQVESLHAQMEIAAESRKYEPTNGRARGADFLRQKLLEAKRRGDISEQAADMAEWFILKNPALVDDLGIGVHTPSENQKASGNYNPLNRVMTLFKESASDTTAVHEILHHLERMMPAEMQAEIRKEWLRAVTGELQKATKAKDQKRIDYFTAVLAGDQKKATELLTGKGMEGFNQFIGERAATWDKATAETAKQMAADGADPRKIWKETGTWLGPDGKWRQEISDDFLGVRASQSMSGGLPFGRDLFQDRIAEGEGIMSGMVNHPPLHKAYPRLGDTDFVVRKGNLSEYGHTKENPKESGLPDEILVQGSPNGVKAAAVHEIQHLIQKEEGFARGGNPTDDENYNELAGEVEARATEERRKLTKEERRNTFPPDSYDVAMSDVVVRFNDLAIGQDYQYLNPSEFWAVRMTSTMAARFEAKSIWARSLQWLKEALQHIKGALGLKSDHPLLKALDDLIARGTGEFVSKEMLGSSEVYASIEKIIDDNNRQRTPEQLAMFKRVGRTVEIPSVSERIKSFRKDFWKKAAQGLVDQFAPIKELSKDAYMLMRQSKGATGAFEVFMRGGRLNLTDNTYDFDDTKKGGVIDRLLTPLQNESGDFMWWVAANRAGTLREEHVKAQAKADQLQADADVLTAKARDLDRQAKDQLQQAGNFPKAMTGNQNAQKQNAKDANQLFAEAKGLRADAEELRQEAGELRILNRERLFSDDDVTAGKSLSNGTTEFDYTLLHDTLGKKAGTVTRDRSLIYRDSLKTFNEFHKNALDMAEQSGLIDPASRAIWEKDFYIPFYRVNDEEGFRGMSVKSGAVRQEAFKQLKGGADKLNSDLLENALMNWAHLIDAAAKNRAAGATIDAAVKLGIAQEVPAGTKGAVWVQEGGKKKHYTIDDPYVLTALTSLEYAGLRGGVMDALSATKHWLTIGVTASPFFKVRNLIRDSIQVIGTSDISYNPAKNLAEGFKATKRGTDEYFRMLAGGGLIRFGTMLEGNEASRTRALVEKGVDPSTILDNESKVKAFYKRTLEPLIEAYNELGNRGEEINRAALYKQLRAQGVSHLEASFEARDLMDFSMQGSWTGIRFLTQTVPFMNARLQGLYKLGKAAKKDPARMATVVGAAAMISLGLLAAYGDDDDWKKREEWDRNNYWWFKAGGIAYRIPKPFEVGAIATMAERTAEWMFDDEMNGKRFAKQFRQVLGDQLAMNPTPQAFKPLIDLYANKDSFSGRPIETMGMEKLDPEYRFRKGTSMIARGVSTAGNAAAKAAGMEFLSPVQVDHLVRGYFSWLGAFVVGGADLAVRAASNEPTRPAIDYWKTATGSMVSETSSASSRYVSQLYEQAKELEEAHGTFRNLLKEGKTAEAIEYRSDNRDKLNRYRSVEAVKRKESQLNNQIRLIERSSMDPETKKARINTLRARQSDVAKALSTRTAQ